MSKQHEIHGLEIDLLGAQLREMKWRLLAEKLQEEHEYILKIINEKNLEAMLFGDDEQPEHWTDEPGFEHIDIDYVDELNTIDTEVKDTEEHL